MPLCMSASTPAELAVPVHPFPDELSHSRLFLSAVRQGFPTGGWDLRPLPVYIPQPSQSEIKKAIANLKSAKKPVMLVASQAMLFGANQQNVCLPMPQ